MIGTEVEIAAREALTRIVLRDLAGHLNPHCEGCFPEKLRAIAPKWRGLADEQVRGRYEELKAEFVLRARVREDSVHWSELVDHPSDDMEQAVLGRIDDLFAEIIPTPNGAAT